MNTDEERPDFLMVRSMANLIVKGLHQGNMQYYNEKTPRPMIQLQSRRQFQPLETMALVRICDSEGNIQRPNGRKEFQQTCMICGQYWKKQQNTQWRCGRCRMPMCKKKRRDVTCFQEHSEMIGNPVLGCGPRRIHFALATEYRKYKSRMAMLEEQPAYNHHFEDEVGSEKSKSTSAAAGGKGKSNRPWRGGSATNYSTTLGSGELDSPLSFTEEAGNDSYNDSISSSGLESSSPSSSNDHAYRVWWDKKRKQQHPNRRTHRRRGRQHPNGRPLCRWRGWHHPNGRAHQRGAEELMNQTGALK
jgi:hypothetical protein